MGAGENGKSPSSKSIRPAPTRLERAPTQAAFPGLPNNTLTKSSRRHSDGPAVSVESGARCIASSPQGLREQHPLWPRVWPMACRPCAESIRLFFHQGHTRTVHSTRYSTESVAIPFSRKSSLESARSLLSR